MSPCILLLPLALAACGRISFDPAEPDATPASDAPPCELGPWGLPQPLTALQSNSEEWGAWISPDKLEVMFASGRAAVNFQLFRSRRNSVGEPFGPPTVVDLGLSLYCDDHDILARFARLAT